MSNDFFFKNTDIVVYVIGFLKKWPPWVFFLCCILRPLTFPDLLLLAHCSAAAANSLQLCQTLCDPIDGSPPGSPISGILQARILENDVGCHFLLQRMKVKSESEVTQSCPTPSDPMDCSLPASSVHGIFQARVLEWVAIAFSKAHCSSTAFL